MISSPSDIAALVRTFLEQLLPLIGGTLEQEVFVAVALDSQNCLRGEPWLVALGTANQVVVAPRDVFREAIRRNAVGVIVCHNHPTECNPSDDDRELTNRLVSAAGVLGLSLLDHVVLKPSGFVSMKSAGLM